MLLNDRDQIIAMTAEWTGERYPNGRPRVSDEKIEILKNLTQEEIWQRCTPADTGSSSRVI